MMRIVQSLLLFAFAAACCSCATAPDPGQLARDIRLEMSKDEDYTRGLCRGVVYEHYGFRPESWKAQNNSERSYAAGLQAGSLYYGTFVRDVDIRRATLEDTLRKYGFRNAAFIGMPDAVYRAAILPMIDRELGKLLYPTSSQAATGALPGKTAPPGSAAP